MESSSLVYVNLDLSVTIATLTAAASRILELRPALAQLYDFGLAAVDELPDAIQGLEFTHAETMACAHPSDTLEDLNREAIQTRDRFIHDQMNLAKGGLIDPCLLGQFTGITGYKAVVTDLRTCVAVYRAIGKAAEGKSCCTAADIDRAEGVMRRMERLIGDRILGRKSTREWIDMRARALWPARTARWRRSPAGFGVGVVVATQNPMDLDYRALSNAGLWCLGRLQTDADRERVLDGLSAEMPSMDLDRTVQRLAQRWFVVRNAHSPSAAVLMQPRQTISLLRGPMTRAEIRKAWEWRESLQPKGNSTVIHTEPRIPPSSDVYQYSGPQPVGDRSNGSFLASPALDHVPL